MKEKRLLRNEKDKEETEKGKKIISFHGLCCLPLVLRSLISDRAFNRFVKLSEFPVRRSSNRVGGPPIPLKFAQKMSGSGRLSSARFDGGDRFYRHPAMRRHQQELLQKQKQQQEQREQREREQKQRVMKPRVSAAVEVESRTESDDSTVSKPSVCSSPPPRISNCTNLDRFLESTAPLVLAQRFSKMSLRGLRNGDARCDLYFNLGDLWESFKEWSAYGAGVPLVLNESDYVVQYYVPYLSAIQLYVNPSATPSWSSRIIDDLVLERIYTRRLVRRVMSPERHHLARKVRIATCIGHQNFSTWREIRHTAENPWQIRYPIYRIPTGPTLQDLDACFLTFHSLSTPITCTRNGQAEACDSNYRKVGTTSDTCTKVQLPAFGLASYKFRGSVWSPTDHTESQQASSLLHEADKWLRSLQVYHPDFRFFISHTTFQR
ncbi:hypothetical protein Syun_008002 [Stephania yunnanensis]|uniref:Uncharacterized protein n=1 Tax=Stephania yunnanensis TaxID=152371 RepID=A0AAP0KZL8_9MAGN